MGDTFLGMPGTQLVTADGTIGRVSLPVRVYHIHINCGAGGNGVVNLRNGSTVAATIWAICNGTASQGITVSWGECGILLPAGCYVDIDANVTSVAVTFATEN